MRHENGEPFGWLLVVDLHGCDEEAVTKAAHIATFVAHLCDDALKMRRFGEPLLEWFGEADPKTEGFSVVQLIETSSVVGHFSALRRSAHIDIFSCKEFESQAAVDLCARWFGAARTESQLIVRK